MSAPITTASLGECGAGITVACQPSVTNDHITFIIFNLFHSAWASIFQNERKSLFVITWTGLQSHRNQLESPNECDPDPSTAYLNGWTERDGEQVFPLYTCAHYESEGGQRREKCVHVFSAGRNTQEHKYSTFSGRLCVHTSQTAFLLTDSQARWQCPRHLAKTEKHSDDITRERRVSWVMSSKSHRIS